MLRLSFAGYGNPSIAVSFNQVVHRQMGFALRDECSQADASTARGADKGIKGQSQVSKQGGGFNRSLMGPTVHRDYSWSPLGYKGFF